MQVIKAENYVRHCRSLVREMTEQEPGKSERFSREWLHQNKWTVVPVEDVSHFNPRQREHLISALSEPGCLQGIAVATEDVGYLPQCYSLRITEQDLKEFNSECGLFRFMLTNEQRTWAISCTESYNLYAATPELLQGMLGVSIEVARKTYLDMVSAPFMDPSGTLRWLAKYYALP